MNSLKNILVGVDFTKRSESALHHAVRLARWTHARLHAFHGLSMDPIPEGTSMAGTSTEELKTIVAESAHSELTRWLANAGAPAETLMHVGVGQRVDTMLETARAISADLIVLGAADSLGGPQRAGTFSSTILRTAPTKVLLVRPEHALPFRKIVACIDFGDSSPDVIMQARHITAQDHSEVHFLHVFQSPWQRWIHQSPLAAALPSLVEQLSGGLHERLVATVRGPDAEGLDLGRQEEPIVRVREAASHGAGIVEHANEIGADLVILGRRAHNDPKFATHGTTVEELLRALPCSVLAVKPPMAAWREPSGA